MYKWIGAEVKNNFKNLGLKFMPDKVIPNDVLATIKEKSKLYIAQQGLVYDPRRTDKLRDTHKPFEDPQPGTTYQPDRIKKAEDDWKMYPHRQGKSTTVKPN